MLSPAKLSGTLSFELVNVTLRKVRRLNLSITCSLSWEGVSNLLEHLFRLFPISLKGKIILLRETFVLLIERCGIKFEKGGVQVDSHVEHGMLPYHQTAQ